MPAPVKELPAHPLYLGSLREPLNQATLVTPTPTEGGYSLYRLLEEKIDASGAVNDPVLQKFLHTPEKAFADRSLLNDENESLVKQNDEKRVRQNTKVKVIDQGSTKIMSYEDVVEAVQKRAAVAVAKRPKKATATKRKAAAKTSAKRGCPIAEEMAAGMREIELAGLSNRCSVLRFDSAVLPQTS